MKGRWFAGVVLVVAVLVAATPAGSTAASVSRTRSSAVRRLRAEVHRLTVERNTARAELEASRQQTAAARAQAAAEAVTLQQTVEQLAAIQQQNATLNSQVASLQAQLAAVPSPLAVAEQQVARDVAWFHDHIALAGYPDGELYALAAMNYVAGHVDAPATSEAPLFAPVGDPDSVASQILGAQLGPCSFHVEAFDAIMHHFGYQTRPVSFYYQDSWTQAPGAHSAVEVSYDGGWHYFDPTYDVYWTDPATGNVLDIQTERSTLAGVKHKDDSLFLNMFEDPFYNGDTTGFETDPATSVVVGQPS